MMENVVDSWSKLKKVTEEYTRIPINYILFIVLNVLIYLNKDQLLSDLVISNSVLKNIFILLLEILSIFYDRILTIYIFVIIVMVLILFLFEKTPVFNLLPKDIEYVNGYTESWNPVSAVNRLFNLLIKLSTSWYVVYVFILFIIKPGNFSIENNYVLIRKVSEESLINFLWNINYLVLCLIVVRSLFVIKYKDIESHLKFSNLRYNVVSEFDSSNDDETIKYLIVKDTYNFKQYYLLKCETHKRELKKIKDLSFNGQEVTRTYWEKGAIPISKRNYKILDKSENLSDLIYYYEELKKQFYNK
ncbi:hypothetical protein FFV08_00275 [Streptococcus sanguinis]|uniref:Uncharacterized protein n=1 Tax=Streptococcus sanguinis TaxID=1305 RepID=A0A7H8V3Z4_STRSA|nr:hypothetical protein FFV08_00275 [Streptococcus sanguinis]